MKDMLNKVIHSKGVAQTAVTAVGNFGSAFISAVAIILISRNLGPSLFGEFSAGFSLALIASRLNDAGITIATQKFASRSENKTQVKSFIWHGYRLKAILTVVLVALSLALSPLLTSILQFSNPFVVPISLVLGLVLTYFDQLVAGLLATHMFMKAALANFLQSAVKLVGSILLLYVYPTSLLPILIIYILAPGTPFLLKSFFEPKWFKKIPIVSLTETDTALFFNLAKHTALLVFVIGIIDSIGILFVKTFLDSYQTGLLGGISRIALLFTLIGVSLSQVLNNRVSRYTSKKDIDTYIKKSLLLVGASLVSFLVVIPFLPLLVQYSIGDAYLVALNPLIILLASVFIYILSVPFGALFYSFEKNSFFSLSGVLQCIAIIGTNFLLVPSFGIAGAAWAQLITRMVMLIFTIIFAYMVYRKKYEYS